MRKLRNVLYITEPNAKISKTGNAISVSVDGREIGSVPLINLEGIVCFSFLGISPALMEACWDHGIGVSFISPYGKYHASLNGKTSGNVLLRKKQYIITDNERDAAAVAQNFIIGKLMNCRTVLQRFSRDHADSVTAEFTAKYHYLSEGISELKSPHPCLNELRGIEGILSKTYFECFNHLIRSSEFVFEGRSRRPPLDPVNAMLSFSYTLISIDCRAALESVGLDPQVGFLHRIRPGRPSLALDLMEELRPYLGDRFVLSLINNRVVQPDDFMIKENGAVLLTDAARKTFLQYWQKRKKEIIMHPYLEEKVEIGLLPYVQALLLARHLRGDIDAYPPFLMR